MGLRVTNMPKVYIEKPPRPDKWLSMRRHPIALKRLSASPKPPSNPKHLCRCGHAAEFHDFDWERDHGCLEMNEVLPHTPHLMDDFVEITGKKVNCSCFTWRPIMVKNLIAVAATVLLMVGISKADSGYNIVQMSTAAPAGTEQGFLSQISAQFNAGIVQNPLASNTYGIKIFGLNPNYQAPAPPPTTLEQALSLGSTVYVYGFAAGMGYQQHVSERLVEGFGVLCSTPIPNIPTWDVPTCQSIAAAIDAALFQESLSTPTVIPPLMP